MSSSEQDSDSDLSTKSNEAEEVSEGEAEAEEAEAAKKSALEEKALKRKAVATQSDDDDDDSDLIDSEEDEELHPKQKKKKKQRGIQDFFIDEAEVDDDGDEEDEMDYDNEGGDIMAPDEDFTEEVGGITNREIDARQRRLDHILDQDEDEVNRYYQDRYEQTDIGDRFGGGEGMSDDITQQGLLPGVKDPNLWVIKCRMGEEKATVLALMRKVIAYQRSVEPLQIKSVLAKEGLSGYIYIEAYKQTHVKQAIEGINALYMGKYNHKMVAINEMTEVLRVVKDTARLQRDQWVRLKRGVYKDDLARVVYVDDANNKARLRLVPRINYNKNRGNNRGIPEEETAEGRRLQKRPPPALFVRDTIKEKLGGIISLESGFYVFEGNKYDSDGFLLKDFYINAILPDGIKPTLTELERFNATPDSMKINNAMKKGTGEVEHSFGPGDVVEVCEGELNKLQGKVITVDGNQIIVQPNHTDLKEPIAFHPTELRKFFEPGNHVKVIAGLFEGDTGLVIGFDHASAIILSDLTFSEIKVVPKDLKLCQERATGVDSVGHFQFGDLVQIDPQNVGVIVLLGKDFFEVLPVQGKIIRLKQNAVMRRRDTRLGQAYDAEKNCIQAKDIVHVTNGPYTGQQGEIRHIYRSWAFVHSRMHPENGGLFVTRTQHLSLRGGGSAKPGGGRGVMGGQPGVGYAPQSPRLAASPAHPSQGAPQRGTNAGSGGGRGQAVGQKKADRQMIGRTVRIVKGVLKGSIGIVKDVMETEWQVELHFPYKTVLVKRDNLALLDSSGKVVGAKFGAATGRPTPSYGDRTPMHGDRTPMHGDKTPNYGSRTPMYGSETPRQDGSRTPFYGAQTPRGDSGNMTPRHAFDPGAATPHHGSATPGHSSHYDPIFDTSPSPSNVLSGDLSSPLAGLGSIGPFTPQTPAGGLLGGTGISPMSSPGSSSRTPSQHDPYLSSPGMYSPLNSVAPYNPATPGGQDRYGDTYGLQAIPIKYVAENTVVQVEVTGMIRKGVIKSVSETTVEVMLKDERQMVPVPISQVYRMEPDAGDMVRIMSDPSTSIQLGHCLSVEGAEGVVKLLDIGKLKLLKLSSLLPYSMPDNAD